MLSSVVARGSGSIGVVVAFEAGCPFLSFLPPNKSMFDDSGWCGLLRDPLVRLVEKVCAGVVFE